ncbi:hypothetical protein V6N13_024556 [Hibiscus sabdariffa]|uniref:BZIP domain-containing protein n=1 Tax=Hibiscus sabdariffa TaxID=183260 RepID=A0ABR2DV03_9ROSI
MAGIKIRDGNNETTPKAPLPKLPSNGNQPPHGAGQGVGNNATMDPKKLKRVVANREYSQRYRMKQMQYIAQLEAGVKALEAQVAMTYPKIKQVDTQNALLRAENSSMKEKLHALSTECMRKQAEYHELKKQKDELKQLSLLQQSPIAETSQAKQHSFTQLLNVARDQPGFNQLAGEAPAPMMQDQDLENQFGSAVNNGENRMPM